MENLFKKFLAFGVGNIIVLILGFISAPIVTRIVSPDDMGKFSIFNTISGLIIFIILLGLDQAFVRFFYEEPEDKRIKLLLKSLKIPIICSLAIFVIIILKWALISQIIIGEKNFIVSILLAIHILFSILSRFFVLNIRMDQNAKLYSSLQVVGKVCYLLTIIILFNFIRNYEVLIIGIVTSNIIITVISIWNQRKKLCKSKNILTNTTTKELLIYGSPLIITMAITWIMQSIDKIFIKSFNGYGELGLYASAFSIIALINMLQSTFTTFWVPVANERYKNNPDDKEFFRKVTCIVTISMISMATFIIMGKDIIILLLGKNFKESMFIFPFLVFIPVMYTISETTVMGITFKKKTNYTIWISLVSATANIIGNLILVPMLGAKGASISTGITYIIFFMTRTIISKKLYNVDYQLKKIIILSIMLSILALYASFNNFDLIILFISILINITIVGLYRKNLKEFYYLRKNSKKIV